MRFVAPNLKRITLLLICLGISFLGIQPVSALSTLPSAPLTVSQSAIAGGIRVTWTTPTDTATGITGYLIEKSINTSAPYTWTQVGSVSSSTYTYDIGGLTTANAVFVRVAATASAGTGTYGYPWLKIYGTTSMKRGVGQTQSYETGFGVGTGNASDTYTASTFNRVRYRLDTTISSVTKYAEADFYEWDRTSTTDYSSISNWDPSVTTLMIPTPNSPYAYSVQANVSDLNVYSDNSNVTNGKNLNGRLEIWPWNYGTAGNGRMTPAGSGTTYDYDDTPSVASGYYGSFQVHDITNTKPVFVWNNLEYGSSWNAEVAYGLNSGTHPDWTFCAQGGGFGTCTLPTSFRLQIFINPPVTPLAGNSTSTISVPTSGSKGVVLSISATSNVSGYFTFTSKGKRIAGCVNRPTSAVAPYIVTCNWKPTVQGQQTVTASFSNSALSYTSSSASGNTFISKRSTTR